MDHTVTQKQITEVILEGMDPENALFASLTFTDRPSLKVIAKIKNSLIRQNMSITQHFYLSQFLEILIKILIIVV